MELFQLYSYLVSLILYIYNFNLELLILFLLCVFHLYSTFNY